MKSIIYFADRKRLAAIIRKTAFFAVLLMLLLAGACGRENGAGEEGAAEKSLYEHGLELVSRVKEMAQSGQYIELCTGDAQLREILQSAGAGDFTKPSAVYRLTCSEGIPAILNISKAGVDKLSEELLESLQAKMFTAVATQINAMGGSAKLAAASVCTAEKLFVSGELKENEIYLYVFENAVPVAVTFLKGEENAVSAKGTFILNDDFPVESIGEATELLREFGMELEEVTQGAQD